MKNYTKLVYILPALIFNPLFSHAFKFENTFHSEMMPHLEKSIQNLCKNSTVDCYVKIYKVTKIKEEPSQVLSAAFIQESDKLSVDVDFIGSNSDSLEKVKNSIQNVAVEAKLRSCINPSDPQSLINDINLQIYKLTLKQKVHFSGGATHSNFSAHTVFAALRLSNDEQEGEVITWGAGYSE